MPDEPSARALRMREYRTTPEGQARIQAARRAARARLDALRELALVYPDDYRRILAKHMRAIPDAKR